MKIFDISGNCGLSDAKAAFRQLFRQRILRLDFLLGDDFQNFILSGISHGQYLLLFSVHEVPSAVRIPRLR